MLHQLVPLLARRPVGKEAEQRQIARVGGWAGPLGGMQDIMELGLSSLSSACAPSIHCLRHHPFARPPLALTNPFRVWWRKCCSQTLALWTGVSCTRRPRPPQTREHSAAGRATRSPGLKWETQGNLGQGKRHGNRLQSTTALATWPATRVRQYTHGSLLSQSMLWPTRKSNTAGTHPGGAQRRGSSASHAILLWRNTLAHHPSLFPSLSPSSSPQPMLASSR